MLGIDANAAALREVSKRARKRRVNNVLFGVLALERAPGEIAGLASSLTVLLPWGSLLHAVAHGDVGPLLATCRAGAEVRLVFGYGAIDQQREALPSLEPADVVARYAARGVAIDARALDDLRALGTTWANKLAFSRHARRFVDVRLTR
ncbi:MAG: hypothetical protein A2138_16955 [Deltaproteobacteria bacterium RBG_16_71_12]|nr:MAG: hypothetical protein A2138_16955 [Deltaproteobacteria bacterium RBG_16_71_12]